MLTVFSFRAVCIVACEMQLLAAPSVQFLNEERLLDKLLGYMLRKIFACMAHLSVLEAAELGITFRHKAVLAVTGTSYVREVAGVRTADEAPPRAQLACNAPLAVHLAECIKLLMAEWQWRPSLNCSYVSIIEVVMSQTAAQVSAPTEHHTLLSVLVDAHQSIKFPKLSLFEPERASQRRGERTYLAAARRRAKSWTVQQLATALSALEGRNATLVNVFFEAAFCAFAGLLIVTQTLLIA
jgi:hypothetical protein